MVAFFDHGSCRFANMLVGHINQLTLGKQGRQGAVLGKRLVSRRMDTAMERFDVHVYLSYLHSNFLPGGISPLWHTT